MGRLPHGPIMRHILSSEGASSDLRHFYVTEYSSKHGIEDFLPRIGKHVGTGHKSNFRPGVYYDLDLDKLDNPEIGKLLVSNYVSSHKQQFKPSTEYKKSEHLPVRAHIRKSGFVKDMPRTLPTAAQVKNALHHLDNTSQRPCTLLYRTINKDPIEKENNMNGPTHFSTENQTRYLGKPSEKMDTSLLTVGRKEGSGFTHAQNIEPITYKQYHSSFDVAYKQGKTFDKSEMGSSFQQSNVMKGDEKLIQHSKRAERNSGYTREIKPIPAYAVHPKDAFTKIVDVPIKVQEHCKKNDPAEFTNLEHSKPYQTMTSSAFANISQSNKKSNQGAVGRKEETGFTENNCKFVETAETKELLQRYNTHYNMRFFDKSTDTREKSNQKQVILQQAPNGFTKSTRVHSFGRLLTRPQQISKMHPSVARSLIMRDPYFAK